MNTLFFLFLICLIPLNEAGVSRLIADEIEIGRQAARHDKGHDLIVFENFPEDPDLFKADLRPHVREIIEKHGHEEWRLCVMTDEIHQHLGIYSIIGTKMGLKAREFFDAGVDELRVHSYAGKTPPVSCLNDGIQVSTGATLGHGTISIADNPDIRPEADFTRNGRTVRFRLKPAYLERIRADVSEGIEKHGDLTPAYFDFIRHLAIRYWLELDRNEIFEIIEELD